jgi:hypothetical protein
MILAVSLALGGKELQATIADALQKQSAGGKAAVKYLTINKSQ